MARHFQIADYLISVQNCCNLSKHVHISLPCAAKINTQDKTSKSFSESQHKPVCGDFTKTQKPRSLNHNALCRWNYRKQEGTGGTHGRNSSLSVATRMLSCSPCKVARHTLITLLTAIALLPLLPNHRPLLQIRFLFFNVPFNAVSPVNPVHR